MAKKDAVLLILGKGERERELKKLASELGIADSVVFAGFQENPFKFLAHARLFVFSSRFEGFGNAMVEAMACSLPVVAFDCRSGIREILGPETDFRREADEIEYVSSGILVPSGNVVMLAEAIINVLKNNELQQKYATRAEKRARNFSAERVIEKWCDLFDSL